MNGQGDDPGRQGDGGYHPVTPPYRAPAQPAPPAGGGGRRRWWLWGLIVLVALVALVASGFAVDRVFFKGDKASGKEFKLADSKSYQEALFDIERYFYRDFSKEKITAKAEAAVEKARKKGETDASKLEDTGLRALVAALDDPHTSYLTREENKRLNEDIKGSFYGVGFMLRTDKELKRPKVFSVMKGSPSERAGIKKDDIIYSVDGWDTRGQNLDVVVSRIRGKKGTTVELEVKRADEKELRTFKIKREKINIPELETEVIDGRYGYLHVFNFNAGTGERVRAAVRDMQKQGVQGFILDLRNNPGGLLDEAVRLSSVFVNDGVIVSYQTKGDRKVDETAQGGAETDLPLVVLTNGGSASSSEITAGALKDLGRAVLVGSKTYGKGSVQKIYQLSNEGGAKLTVSLYYLPNGESIDGKGIEPDVVVELKDDAEKEEQLQLDRAKQVLENLIQGKPPTAEELRPAA